MSTAPVATQPISEHSTTALQGWRIVITRSEEQADSLAEKLRLLGAEPIAYPTITFAPPEDIQLLDDSLQRLLAGEYHWLMLTSVNTIKAVQARLSHLQGQHTFPSPCPFRVAAVGPTTTAACRDLLGVQPAVVPKKFVAEALAEAMGDMHGQRVLLTNADIARPVLQEKLQQAGAHVDRIIAYRTVPATGGADLPDMLAEGSIDAITFTSGSTAHYFVERIGADALEHARRAVIACIGPIAAKGAEEVGLPPTIVASTYTEDGLIEALVTYAAKKVL